MAIDTWGGFLAKLQTLAQTDKTANEALHKLNRAGLSNNDHDFSEQVLSLVDTFEGSLGLSNLNRQDLVRESAAWRKETFLQAQPQQPLPKQDVVIRNHPHSEKGKEEKIGSTHESISSAGQQLMSLQEQMLMDEFKSIQNIKDPSSREAALNKFLEGLDIPSLIAQQHNIITKELQKTFQDKGQLNAIDNYLTIRQEEVASDWETQKNNTFKELFLKRLDQTLRHSFPQQETEMRSLIKSNLQYAYQQHGDVFLEKGFLHQPEASNGVLPFSWYTQLINQFVLLVQQAQGLNAEIYVRYQQPVLHAPQGIQSFTPTYPPPGKNISSLPNRPSTKHSPLSSVPGLGNAGNIAKKEIKRRVIQFLFLSPPYIGWWIVGIIAALLFIGFVIVAAVSLLKGGATPSTDILSGPQCANTLQCRTELSQLGITLTGNLSLNGDPNGKVAQIYNTIQLVSQPPSQFLQLLKLPATPVTINVGATGCGGHSNYNGVDYFGWCNSASVNRFILLHELGHVIAFRNPALFGKFYIEGLLNSFFSSIFNPSTLPTFNCRYDYGIGPYPGECWADSVGEYVTYPYYRNTVSGNPTGPYNFTNFPSFANGFYYNFMSDNIYKGADYSKITTP